MAADPTYPLYPAANILAATLLLLVLLTSAIRRSWNLGLAFLCFWLFFEALADGVNGIVWSDNADAKLYVYCDIGQSGFTYSVLETDLVSDLPHKSPVYRSPVMLLSPWRPSS